MSLINAHLQIDGLESGRGVLAQAVSFGLMQLLTHDLH